MMVAETDVKLIELIKTDDHRAFKILVDRYWESLYRHIYQRIKQEDDSKDIIQEIFISLWRNRQKLQTDANDTIASYIFKSAKYAIIDHFSKANTTLNREVELSSLLAVATGSDAESAVTVKELKSLVSEELESLPDRLRVPYELSRENNLSIKEIAAFLEVSEQTVKNNISITLDKLRRRIKDYDPDFLIFLIVVTASASHA